MFDTFDQYLAVYRDHGVDLSERDPNNSKAREVCLRDWLDFGKKNIKEKLDNGLRQRDAIATPDISPWLPQVIENNLLETQEPLLVLNSLFERIPFRPGQVIQMPAIGAVTAARVAEGQSYPTVRLQMSGATVTSTVGKYGLQFELSEEAINNSRFDLIQLHLRECGRALARLKETYAANIITNLGVVAFDNTNPSVSMFGVTHGRSLNGTANGSLILDDLFDAFSLVMNQGFVPDTLIMHPLTFVMFLKDEVLRSVMLAGGNQIWYGGWTGNPAARAPGSATHKSGGLAITPGGAANGGTASGVNQYNTSQDGAPIIPSRWPWPLKIVVSPWIPFHPGTKKTDIVLCDSMNLGYYVEQHPVQVDRWEDMAVDMTKIKLKERYSHQIKNEGLGIAVLKNVKVVANEIVLPARTTHAVSGELVAIPKTSPIA
jgi:hypothetical protein